MKKYGIEQNPPEMVYYD